MGTPRSSILLPLLFLAWLTGCGDDEKGAAKPTSPTQKSVQGEARNETQELAAPEDTDLDENVRGEALGPTDATGLVLAPEVPRLERIPKELEQKLAAYDGRPGASTNVLLITFDSSRRDFFGCYGYRPPLAKGEKTTPNIDRIAAEGVVMEDFYTNTSWTLPSHMSLFTGQPDLLHAVDGDPWALPWRHPTMAQVLHRLGYATFGFYTGPYVHERFGFDRGFEIYEDAYGPVAHAENQKRAALQEQIDRAVRSKDLKLATERHLKIQQIDLALNRLSHKDRSAQIATDKALAAIEKAEAEKRPWCVFVHYFDPHYDYDPPAEYGKRFDPDYHGDIDGLGYYVNPKVRKLRQPEPTFEESLQPGEPPRTTERNIGDRDLEHIRSLYAAELAWTDAQVGRLFDALRERGSLDRTLVMLTADHGEEFFEHGGIAHRDTLYEEVLRIPMVMRLPEKLPAGKHVHGLAALCDVFPTVMDLLGQPTPAELQSRSFLPLIDGSSDGSDRYVLGRLIFENRGKQGPPIKRITVRDTFRTGSIKVVRHRHYRVPVLGECPPERAENVTKLAQKSRTTDLALAWIDLAVHPEEQPGQFSAAFDDPRAAAALAQFQAVYGKLLALPHAGWMSLGGEAEWAVRDVASYHQLVDERRAQYEVSTPGK